MSTALWLGLALLCTGAGRRLSAPWKGVCFALGALLLLRVLLLGNPIAWNLYASKLKAKDIGWRQESSVLAQAAAGPAPGQEVAFLAVGSSQTGAIFQEYASQHPRLDVFTLAALSPIDLVLYRETIFERRPETILLYLGVFDLAMMPSPAAITTAPAQGGRLLQVLRDLRTAPSDVDYRQSRVDLVVGELLPEYKYGFVFRGIIDKAVRLVAERSGRPPPPTPRPPLDERIEMLREALRADAIPFNLRFLEQFLEDAERAGIEVVLVEGSINPRVANQTLALGAQARQALLAVAAVRERVRFLPSDEIMTLVESDFSDLTHVTPEAGDRLSVRVMNALGQRATSRVPTPRDAASWRDRLETLRERVRAASGARLVFLGDSITEYWEREGAREWERRYARVGALNLGIAGDQTQHLLWRLEHMDLERLQPEAAIVMIGTNNTAQPDQSVEEIVLGIHDNVRRLHEKWPSARILLLGLLPRDGHRYDIPERNLRVNAQLALRAEAWGAHYLDLTPQFADSDGALAPELAQDPVHLNLRGYERWAEATAPLLDEWLGEVARKGP